MESLHQTGVLGSLEMVEVNPELAPDSDRTTEDTAASLIVSAMGNTLL